MKTDKRLNPNRCCWELCIFGAVWEVHGYDSPNNMQIDMACSKHLSQVIRRRKYKRAVVVRIKD